MTLDDLELLEFS